MLIFGVDPGTATTGWGIIEFGTTKPKSRVWGLIQTETDPKIAPRLEKIYKETLKLLRLYKPDVFVMEKVFFATNAKTAISVGQAQGVMLLAAQKVKIEVFEYAPGTIKKTITGSGRGNKKDVQKAVRKFLGNHIKSQAHKKTHFDNAADALAIALTHAAKLREGVIAGV